MAGPPGKRRAAVSLCLLVVCAAHAMPEDGHGLTRSEVELLDEMSEAPSVMKALEEREAQDMLFKRRLVSGRDQTEMKLQRDSAAAVVERNAYDKAESEETKKLMRQLVARKEAAQRALVQERSRLERDVTLQAARYVAGKKRDAAINNGIFKLVEEANKKCSKTLMKKQTQAAKDLKKDTKRRTDEKLEGVAKAAAAMITPIKKTPVKAKAKTDAQQQQQQQQQGSQRGAQRGQQRAQQNGQSRRGGQNDRRPRSLGGGTPAVPLDAEIKDMIQKTHPFPRPTGDGKGSGERSVMLRQRMFMKEKKKIAAKLGRSWTKGLRTEAGLRARTRLQQRTPQLRSELASYLNKHLNLARSTVDAMIGKRMKDMNIVRGTPEGTLVDLKYREQSRYMRVTPELIRKANNILSASIESKFLPCETDALLPTITAQARQAHQKRIERLARVEVKKQLDQAAKAKKAKELATKQAKRATKAADNNLSRKSPSKAAKVLEKQEKIARIVSNQNEPKLRQFASGMNAALKVMKTAALNMKQKNAQGKPAPALAASAQAKFEKLQALATASLKKSPADEVRALNAQIISISGPRSDKENVKKMAAGVAPK